MKRLGVLLIAASATLVAQSRPPASLKVWFPDGAGVEIRTESTARTSPLSTGGYVSSAPSGEWHRVVLDREDNVPFAYDIEARKVDGAFVRVRLKPVNAAGIRGESWLRGKRLGDVPTLVAPRGFPLLSPGDAVQLDILQHPTTGEKIYDVLRVLNDGPPSGGGTGKPTGGRISLQKVRVVLNGETIHEEKNTWFTGAAILLRLPTKGAFYVSLKPNNAFPFQAVGTVEGNVLRFPGGGATIELVSQTDVLTTARHGTVWVYHDPASAAEAAQAEALRREMVLFRGRYGSSHPDMLAMQRKLAALERPLSISCADDVDWLLKNNR